jgi:hypothetical protein
VKTTLKVPKREIFHRSDFPDFYTIKSLRVGDFGVKIKKIVKIFRGSFRGAKFLTCMLSLFLKVVDNEKCGGSVVWLLIE